MLATVSFSLRGFTCHFKASLCPFISMKRDKGAVVWVEITLFLCVFVIEQHNRKLLNVFYLEIAINQKTVKSQTPNLVLIPFPLVSFTHYLFNKW